MKFTKDIETETLTKEVPYLVIKLSPHEVRELYKDILNIRGLYKDIINSGDNTNFKHDLLQNLTEFLSDYDSGKYDKLTKVKP